MKVTYKLLIIAALNLIMWVSCKSSSSGQNSSGNSGSPINTAPVVDTYFDVFNIDYDLSQVQYRQFNSQVLKSSNYYPGVRSLEGHNLLINTFPSQSLIRVNAFDRAVIDSEKCLNSNSSTADTCIDLFQKSLNNTRPYIDQLTQNGRTQYLMFDIFRTPIWLSTYPDLSSACGGGRTGQSFPAKDMNVWKRLLDVVVAFAKDIEAKNKTKILYQFWNEPDLACNWKASTTEFLNYYSVTATHLRSAHGTAKIGGPGLGYWNGRLEKDGASRSTGLAFELMKVAQANSIPMDFVSFHYFSKDVAEDYLKAIDEYRSYQKSLGITNQDIILSEWLPKGSGLPYLVSKFQAADAARLFQAMSDSDLFLQGGLPWQDYGSQQSDEWGIVSYPAAKKKPIFDVYEFFDGVARTSSGVWYKNEGVTLPSLQYTNGNATQIKLKIGERSIFVSKDNSNNCYRSAVWYRLGDASEIGVSSLLKNGFTTSDIEHYYGSLKEDAIAQLKLDIQANKPCDPRFKDIFSEANKLYYRVESLRANQSAQLKFDFRGMPSNPKITAFSTNRDGAEKKSIAIDNSIRGLTYIIKAEEVVLLNICE